MNRKKIKKKHGEVCDYLYLIWKRNCVYFDESLKLHPKNY